ncbi:MAG: antibiotic biosynthesis monooxygenase, partial [Proteobacteria bacterium]|nr:antibiotic biosynthesis monooxygenase [Pseudomonadota bacterium]
MIAVIFEVKIDPARGERYFDLAKALREKLDQADGFIS